MIVIIKFDCTLKQLKIIKYLFPIFLFSSSLLIFGGSLCGGFSFDGVLTRLPELRLGVKLFPVL